MAVADEQPARRDLALLLGTLPPAQRSGVSVSALKVQVDRGLKRLANG